jgi:hypothetical protein
MITKAVWGAIALIALRAAGASSADLCKAIALRDVAAIEDPHSFLSRGAFDDAITQYRVNKITGMTSFCSHGGYCYPDYVRINGKKYPALRLVNCKIGGRFDEDQEDVYYSIDVDRSKNSAAALRLDDLDNKFLEMGLCSACADNVARYYVEKPSSQCARLAKKALEGNHEAEEALRSFPGYCTWSR